MGEAIHKLFGILIKLCVNGLAVTTSHAHNKLSGFRQELIIVEGECLTLHRPVKNDPEKFKGILSVKLCNL